MNGKLTTHVLDLSNGTTAAGMKVELYRIAAASSEHSPDTQERRIHLKTGTTNLDGRLDNPLLKEEEMEAGGYELLFHVGAYYRSKEAADSFLEVVPIRFRIANPQDHYHVPLLVAPGGYSTYRGS